VVVIVIAVLTVAVLASPSVLPRLGLIAGKLFKREIVLRRLEHRVLLTAAVFTCVAWLMYGVAFWLFTIGVLGHASGALRNYVAVFAGSYLIGFVALFSPAGAGVREGAMALALQRAGFAAGPALLLVVASRLWLTALEVIPPLIFLAFVRRRRLSIHEEDHSPTR
jgi:glycosyltransferase 2 family protein